MPDVGGLIVRDVDAMVLPDEALSENLLGLSFLSRLKRFEYAYGQMALEQEPPRHAAGPTRHCKKRRSPTPRATRRWSSIADCPATEFGPSDRVRATTA